MEQNNIGELHISQEVIATITAQAASQVEGVFGLANSITSNIKDLIGIKSNGKGVSVEFDEQQVTVSLNLVVKYGYKIQEVALNVQNKVMKSIADMTGYSVLAVNVNVVNVDIPKAETVEETK